MADGGSLPPHVGADLGADLGLGLPRRLVEQLERDVSSWQEIRVTLLFTLLTSLVFLGLFIDVVDKYRGKPSAAAPTKALPAAASPKKRSAKTD